ncbi:hypothetical protein [Streptomyces scabiei]|uniref:hypothetical protein n=1 Tax=Streptomyces scabiei TaxID=1930 RepID=UPI000765ACFE|nr:hypothetical protein [Streptomyces scabiei]
MEAVPAAPRRDDTVADTRSLIDLGRVEPQPIPAPAPTAPPADSPAPQPKPDPADVQEAAELTDALTEAGVTATAEDRAAVQALAKLDAATVAAVTRWMKTKKTKPETGSK